VSTDLSGEHIASIFRVEEIRSARNQQASRWQAPSGSIKVGEFLGYLGDNFLSKGLRSMQLVIYLFDYFTMPLRLLKL
jgi:hypothetical protein